MKRLENMELEFDMFQMCSSNQSHKLKAGTCSSEILDKTGMSIPIPDFLYLQLLGFLRCDMILELGRTELSLKFQMVEFEVVKCSLGVGVGCTKIN